VLNYVSYDKDKVHIKVFHQYPTFNWVSFTHIHRDIIYRESYTLIPLYLILCNNINSLKKKYLLQKYLLLCIYLANCWLLCLKWCQIFFRSNDSFWLGQNHSSCLLLMCTSWVGFYFKY
jgi:hypothetical protein